MRSFFLQIFLSFWLATAGIFIVATTFAPRNDPGNPEQLRVALDSTLRKLAAPAMADYKARGCPAITGLAPEIAITSFNGKPLCSAPLEPAVETLLADARGRNQTLFMREGDSAVQVSPFTTVEGEHYFLVQRVASSPRPWWPHLPPVAIPVTLVVTFIFAYILTRPVRALSLAFRRFSAGNMDVRLPISPSRWRDIGGADIRTLMVDFNYMADRVKELMDAQKLLVRDISHELRSPLARLQVALEIAREESPSSTEILDQATAEADRLNVLIGELLTLSLMESMRQAPVAETFSLGEIFEILLPDMRFEAESNGASIVYRSDCDAVMLHGHPEMLRRAFENIIRNAIRYTPAGSSVEIAAICSAGAGEQHAEPVRNSLQQRCDVTISDRGPGVPDACLSEIFRPFYRVDMAREGTTGGFGVGLAIAERAVHLHRGHLQVENRDGGGLAVTVHLPLD